MDQPLDLSQLAAQIGPILAPFLPYLLKGVKKAGEKAFEKAGEKLTETGWEKAGKIWGKIRPVAEKKPATLETLAKVSEHPEDPKSETVLEWSIQELLRDMPDEILVDLKQIVNEGTNTINLASGDRSIAINGGVENSVINSGDINSRKGAKKQ